MQSYIKNTNENQRTPIFDVPGDCLPGITPLLALAPLANASPLGLYANKVAKTDIQTVTLLENKPQRTQHNKIKYEIKKRKLASQRNCDCGYKPLGGNVEIHWNNAYNSAKIANVETCGSVWACPVCRTKILKKRAEELKTIGKSFRDDGGYTCMVTLTVPHYNGQTLNKVLGQHKSKQGITGAFARLRQHRRWRNIMNKIGCVADVRSIETTHGKNGWHVHIHVILYFMDEQNYVMSGGLKSELHDLWSGVCLSAGMNFPNMKHGVEITNGDDSYLAKWGSPNELTSAAAKQAKNGNKSIAEIECLLISKDEFESNEAAGLLREYYSFFHNRKMLTWGGEFNLRKTYLEKPDVTDHEIACDEHGDGEKLFVIAYSCWKLIYHTGNVGDLLNQVENNKEYGIFNFLVENRINKKDWGVFRCVKDVIPDDTVKENDQDYYRDTAWNNQKITHV